MFLVDGGQRDGAVQMMGVEVFRKRARPEDEVGGFEISTLELDVAWSMMTMTASRNDRCLA